MMLKEEINFQISNLHDLVNEFKALDAVIEKTEETNMKTQYLEYLLETIEDYKVICKNLRANLEQYFDYEKLNEVPMEFDYHRLAKALDSIKF